MSQLNLFDLPIETPIQKKESKIETGKWYNVDGYKDPVLVTLVMNKWVELDNSVSSCFYARICDLKLIKNE